MRDRLGKGKRERDKGKERLRGRMGKRVSVRSEYVRVPLVFWPGPSYFIY